LGEWKLTYEGKTHDVWQSPNGRSVALQAKDSVSADDMILEGVTIPDKGVMSTQMSGKWFRLTEHVVPNAVLGIDDEELSPSLRVLPFAGRTIEMLPLKMVPIEAIIRGYITGSMWRRYNAGERRFGDCTIPDGLLEAMQLPTPFYTPTTKEPAGTHDRELSFDDTISVISKAGFENPREIAEQIRDYSLRLYCFCAGYAKGRDLILADTKFEFGVDMETGRLYLADEICTFDSSRFWLAENHKIGHSQEQLTTFIIRDWVKQHPGEAVPDEIMRRAEIAYRLLFWRLFN